MKTGLNILFGIIKSDVKVRLLLVAMVVCMGLIISSMAVIAKMIV